MALLISPGAATPADGVDPALPRKAIRTERQLAMPQSAPQPVELPDQERVVAAQRLQAGIKPRSLIDPTRCGMLICMVGIAAHRDQRITL